MRVISALLLGISMMLGACDSSVSDQAGESEAAISEPCGDAERGAEAIALRAADLRVTSTRRSALTTIGSVVAADPQPAQHEPADLDRPVCAFVFEGSRQQKTSLMLVVVDPDDVDGEVNLLGHTVDGGSEPEWWTDALSG